MKIRRILVALDASPASRAAAEAAVELAAHLEAELVGLFVEDAELLRLGSLPAAREVSLTTARVRRCVDGELGLRVRVQARQARRSLQVAARRRRVSSSFRVARGRVADELSEAAEDVDLVALGRIGWSRRRHDYVGATARDILGRRGRVLVLGEAQRLAPPVAVVYDGGEAATRALDLAVRLTGELGDPLVILLHGAPERADKLRRQAIVDIDSSVETREVRFVPAGGREELVEAAAEHRIGVLVVPTGPENADADAVVALLRNLALPVLVVS